MSLADELLADLEDDDNEDLEDVKIKVECEEGEGKNQIIIKTPANV